MRHVLLAAVLAVCGGCEVKTDYSGTNFACDEQTPCPPDYLCLPAGFCVTRDWQCGRPNVLADDFDDGIRSGSWEWGGEDGAAVAEEEGHAYARPATDAPQESEAFLMSSAWYQWGGAGAYVEVPQTVTQDSGARAVFAIVFDNGEEVSFEQEAGQLVFRKTGQSGTTSLGSVLYDPEAHRWWRIRSGNGETVWEAGPDILSWNRQFEEPQEPQPEWARIKLGAVAPAGASDPGTAHFDNVNGGRQVGRACPFSDLDADFETGGGGLWLRSYELGGAHRNVGNGEATVTLDEGHASEAAFVSSTVYRLLNTGISLEVAGTPAAAAGVSTWVKLTESSGAYLAIRLEGDTLVFEENLAGAPALLGTVLYDREAHRRWGFSERDGVVHFSTSNDGSSWESQVTAATTIRLDALTLSFGASATSAPDPVDRTARFDNVH